MKIDKAVPIEKQIYRLKKSGVFMPHAAPAADP
jgi:hypothetical protein